MSARERVGPVESSFLPLKADQDFPLPAFPDALDSYGREVDGHPILEAWTEKSVHVWVRRPAHAAVLVDGENTLRAAGCSAEGLLHGVTQDAVAERAVKPAEAFGGGVVHRQDEPEVDGASEAARVLPESFPDRQLVAPHGAVTAADSNQAGARVRCWSWPVNEGRAFPRRAARQRFDAAPPAS